MKQFIIGDEAIGLISAALIGRPPAALRDRAQETLLAVREKPVQEDPRINFLGVQVESLIERLAASQVAAGLITMQAAQGFIQKEAMPIRAVLAQIAEAHAPKAEQGA